MEKTKSIISWGQLFIIVGTLLLFLFAFTQKATFEKPAEVLPVEGFVFSGATITNYEGTDSVVNIPSSFSYGPTTNFSGSITFNNRSQANQFLQEHYSTGADGYYDFYQQIYSHSYPWYYEYSIDKPSYVAGNDFQITSISANAFQNNTSIEKVIIPSSIERIGNFAFQYCSNLKEIEFNEGLTFIGDSSFWGCAITELTNLPNSLETIYPYAFFDCDYLEKVIIPKNVKEMTLGTFNSCDNLQTVTILSEFEIEAWDTDVYHVFSNCNNLKTIYVPSKMLSYYQSTIPWSKYSSKYKIM